MTVSSIQSWAQGPQIFRASEGYRLGPGYFWEGAPPSGGGKPCIRPSLGGPPFDKGGRNRDRRVISEGASVIQFKDWDLVWS